MGSVFSSASGAEEATTSIEERVEAVLVKKKLLELKQAKMQRDIQLATNIARSRDMVHWMGGFLTGMVTINVLKAAVLRTGSLTISSFPFLAVPAVLAYQADLAYGTKMERVYHETRTILKKEKHWFNEPMALPPYLEPAYRQLQDTHNAKLIMLGRQPDKDWACFKKDMTDEEILDHSYPLTRSLASHQYGLLYSDESIQVVTADENANNSSA